MIVMRIDFFSYKESCQYLSVLHLVHINVANFIRIDQDMKGNNRLQGIQSIVHKFPCCYGKSVTGCCIGVRVVAICRNAENFKYGTYSMSF